jgi:hypothetical protein
MKFDLRDSIGIGNAAEAINCGDGASKGVAEAFDWADE